MPLMMLGITIFACGLFTVKRPDTRLFGGFGDPYVTARRLMFTRIRGVLTLVFSALLILYALLQYL